jgi:hypothetical protein
VNADFCAVVRAKFAVVGWFIGAFTFIVSYGIYVSTADSSGPTTALCDEAGQLTICSALANLTGCERAILVGKDGSSVQQGSNPGCTAQCKHNWLRAYDCCGYTEAR